jgi:hypothetical protein
MFAAEPIGGAWVLGIQILKLLLDPFRLDGSDSDSGDSDSDSGDSDSDSGSGDSASASADSDAGDSSDSSDRSERTHGEATAGPAQDVSRRRRPPPVNPAEMGELPPEDYRDIPMR